MQFLINSDVCCVLILEGAHLRKVKGCLLCCHECAQGGQSLHMASCCQWPGHGYGCTGGRDSLHFDCETTITRCDRQKLRGNCVAGALRALVMWIKVAGVSSSPLKL